MHKTKFSFDYDSALKRKLTKFKKKNETVTGAMFLQHIISLQVDSSLLIY